MKKLLWILLATAVLTTGLGACGGGESATQSDSDTSSEAQSEVTLNEAMRDTEGNITYTLKKDVKLEISNLERTILGKAGANITVEGEDHVLTAIGDSGCNGFVCAGEGGSLTFKNVIFENQTSDVFSGDWNYYCLEFGGKLNFENCTFKKEINLMGNVGLNSNVEAVFKNCTFYSTNKMRYSVWVSNGDVSFENCTFTVFNPNLGGRGLKLHESRYGDIVKVEVDRCQFLDIASKPGIVLGTLNESTTISVVNSTFTGCAAWARDGLEGTGGSFEGVDGFYEADIYTSEYDFSYEGNTIDGIPDTEVAVETLP